MGENEHGARHEPTGKPTEEEVAKKAHAIYVKEGRPQGHAHENWADAEARLQHAGAVQAVPQEPEVEHQGHQDHHAHMAADFRKRPSGTAGGPYSRACFAWGVLLTPALGAALMSVSTVIVAVDARLLQLNK